jgi:4a-hydroxytetrahydrobiopterin dehydratase
MPRILTGNETATINEFHSPGNAKATRSEVGLPPLVLRRILFTLENYMPAKKLTAEEVQQHLSQFPGWSLKDGKLHRAFECKDFVAAFGNMTRVALVAESMNHHPEWFNVYNKVVIDLNTHSVSGISELDFKLASKIDQIFAA